MNRRGLSLLEMLLAIGITSIIGAAIASMMAAASNSLSSKDDGRQSAIRLATTQVRLGAYIAPSRCILDKSNTHLTLWLEDSRENNTVHASEIRWLSFDENKKILAVDFVDFPDDWSQSMIDSADVACTPSTNYEALLAGLRADDIIESVPLIDLVESCNFWTNNNDPLSATHVCVRFAFSSEFGITNGSIIDETIRIHQPPSEQQ
jgi:type II secretory pathway pseudopilin PulG